MAIFVKKISFKIIQGLFFGSLLISFFIILYFIFIYTQIPSEKEIKNPCFVTKMNQVFLCPNQFNYVKLSEVPKHFIDILIISEDSRFWHHHGFDLFELEKSIELNFKKKSFVRGGSTITQQLAKNLFLTKEKSLNRKLSEALITLKLEKHLSKKEILEKYINIIEFGENIYGLKKATNFYFNKNPKDLLPEESSFLVMLLPNPIKYSKSFYIKKLTPYAFSRISTLLSLAYKRGHISDEEFKSAQNRVRFLFNSLEDLQKEMENSQDIEDDFIPIENGE